MILNLEMIEEEHDFILLFGDNSIINEDAFEFNKVNGSKNQKLKDSNIGCIRIRNKMESSNVTGERSHGLSIKVDFDADHKSIPVPIDRKTGDINMKQNIKGLAYINKYDHSKINYIQNFIYYNLDDIIGYYDSTNEEDLNYYKNKILSNSVGKSFKKKVK